jgi:hypothetical protein
MMLVRARRLVWKGKNKVSRWGLVLCGEKKSSDFWQWRQ